MNKHLKIELDDATSKLVERQLETGNFDSAEDVIRASMQMMDEQRERIEALDAALQEGIDSGFVDDFDFDAFWAEKRRQHEGRGLRGKRG